MNTSKKVLQKDDSLCSDCEDLFTREDPRGFLYHVKNLTDKRQDRGKRYSYGVCIAILIWGFISGISSVKSIAERAQHLEEQTRDENGKGIFTRLLNSKHGVPSHDTLSRVLRTIDQEELLKCFMNWINVVIKDKGYHLAIDGKAIRAAKDKVHGHSWPPYVLNVYDITNDVCVYQLKIDNKKNEVSTIPELIEQIMEKCPELLEGSTITTDGIGTSKKILEIVDIAGASVVSPVKDNHKELKEEGADLLDKQICAYKKDPDSSELTFAMQQDKKSHGRNENRIVVSYVLTEDECFIDYPTISTIAVIIRFREEIRKGAKRHYSVTKTYYQSTAPMDAQEILEFSREHWGCEAQHWKLDNNLHEDRSTAKKDQALANQALLRKVAANYLEKEKEVLACTWVSTAINKLLYNPKLVLDHLVTGSLYQ